MTQHATVVPGVDLSAVLKTYLSAWNDPDAAARTLLLERSVADDVVFVDPMARLEGREALAAHISDVRARFPGVSYAAVGEIDKHHNVLRHAWVANSKDGVLLRGLDVDEVGPDGRLTRILGFFHAD